MILNDVDVSGDLLIEGAPEARRVSYNNLVTDTLYEAVIEATDSAGGVARAIHSFGTVSRGGGEVIDEFDEDPLADPLWELYEPEAPAIYTTDDGFFRVTIPTGVNLDHWVAADRAILLRRLDFPEDFIIETRMRIVGSGDPFAPILPPVEENYLANLMVQFSRFDAFHWGPQRGTNLASQRSGNTVPRCDAFSSLEELSLQIRKLGSTYTFSWRAADDQEWNETCSRVVSEPPLFVGLMFKTWALLTFEQTFEFDYFKILEVPVAPPDVSVCDTGETDIAWAGMPFRRSLDVRGFPAPDVEIVSGPPGLEYSPDRGELSGWTPVAAGAVTIELAASNSQGNQSLTIPVEVLEDPRDRDDDFEDDPRESFDYWEFHEPQTGIAYELVEDGDGSTWWRLAVPQFGDLGENFDHWVTVDRAPQLRHPVVAGENFVAETRVRIVPEAAPLSPTEPFLAGLMLHFGEFDVLHWNIGQERSFALRTTNLFLERSGTNNIARGQVDEMMAGRPVQLRIERKYDDYQCFYRGDGDEEWTLAGTHTTTDEPLFVGLIMKTWAGGSTFSVDFDYFDILTPGDEPTTALFARGDADSNGAINLTDAIVILGFLFLGTAPPNCMDAADVDDSGGDRVTLTDAVVLLNWLFLGRDAPPPPSPSTATYVPADCGPDPTEDPLGCKSPAERCP